MKPEPDEVREMRNKGERNEREWRKKRKLAEHIQANVGGKNVKLLEQEK